MFTKMLSVDYQKNSNMCSADTVTADIYFEWRLKNLLEFNAINIKRHEFMSIEELEDLLKFL